MSTNNTWDSLADAGGALVAQRLHSAGTVDALATRVAKGRQRRGVLQAGASVAAVGALGIGALGVLPEATDGFLQPSGMGYEVHVDDSVEFVGRRNDNTWGPHWIACGDVWEPPAEAGVTVPSDQAAVPNLRQVVVEQPAVGEWREVLSGDTVALENSPAVLSYVSWPREDDEPAVWSSETLGALVDGDGVVVGIAFEQPPGFTEHLGPNPLEGEMFVRADLNLYLCEDTATFDSQVEAILSERFYLEGDYSLHTVTQVYSVPQPDIGEGYEVLATFVDYGRAEPFEFVVDPTSVREYDVNARDEIEQRRADLAGQIVNGGQRLEDARVGLMPVVSQCDRINYAQSGWRDIVVLPTEVPDLEFEVVRRGQYHQTAPQDLESFLWLATEGSMEDAPWWNGFGVLILLFDDSDQLVTARYDAGSTQETGAPENLLLQPLVDVEGCAFGDVVPGTYTAVAVIDAPVPDNEDVDGLELSYETWVHLGEVEVPAE